MYCAELPDGFTATLTHSSHPSIIALDGTITPPDKETQVTLKLKITQDETGANETRTYTVTVPPRSGHAGWDSYKDSKVGMFIHYLNFQIYPDGTATKDKNEAAEAFDVDGVVDSAVKWNVDYIMLTAWHGDMVTLHRYSAPMLR